MDYVADSDAENSFPALMPADVDTERLMNVVAFFSENTRARLRREAENTPFAVFYEKDATDFGEIGNNNREIGSENNGDVESLRQSEILGETPDSYSQTEHDIPSQLDPTRPAANSGEYSGTNPGVISENTSVPIPESAAQAQGILPARGSRSLRKRTFSSRHPYIADQADWLGICTHDSINEMFEGAEDINSVVRVLNQLYLKKKKRYPDEDRYRSKDIYTHLGHSKSLAIQGDSELREYENNADSQPNQNDSHRDSGERVYDPEAQSSQIDISADEEDALIPYEDFDIPYSQDDGTCDNVFGNDTRDAYSDENANPFPNLQPDHGYQRHTQVESDSAQSSGSEASEAEEEEQYIRVGGRYRRLSTILRGVLPESAKRLGILDKKQTKTKRRKPAKRILEPRRGLAMRKVTASGADTAELERELFAHAEIDEDFEKHHTKQPVQPLIVDNFADEQRSSSLGHSVPQLSRTSTSLSYVSDTPEPHMVDSGSESESDIEMWPTEEAKFDEIAPYSASAQTTQKQSRLWEDSVDGEVQEFDEIDHLFAPRDSINKKKLIPKTKSIPRTGLPKQRAQAKHPRPSDRPKRTYTKSGKYTKESLNNRRMASRKVSLGRPASTQRKQNIQKPSEPYNGKKRKSRVIDRVQSRLPAFHKAQGLKHLENVAGGNTRATKTTKAKPSNHPIGRFTQQHYKRNPVMSTSAIEVESNLEHSIHPVVYDSVIQRFQPTRQSLLGSASSYKFNSLAGFEDLGGVRALKEGRRFFPNEDSLDTVFLGKHYLFALYNSETASKNVSSLIASIGKSLANSSSLLHPGVKPDMEAAIKALMKWLLISRERPYPSLWTEMRSIMAGFSKLQTKEVRVAQISIQSQLLFLFWIMIQLEQSHRFDMKSLAGQLETYTCDIFVTLFSSFSASEFSSTYAVDSPDHKVYEGVMLVLAIHEIEDKCWWPAVVQAIDEMPEFESENAKLVDLTYLLSAMIPKKHQNWSPYSAILTRMKNATDSVGHCHFIDTCILAHARLEWQLEEKILTQLYGFFGSRKFGNFPDETSVPTSLQTVHTRSDIPDGSTFEKFLKLLYIYISQLSSAKDVKRLISKLLASSQYHYVRGRKSQIMFVNRLNLIVLLSSMSEIDLSSQLANLIKQTCDSADPFVYGRSLDALSVFCENASSKNKAVPSQAFAMLFENLAEMTTAKKIVPNCFLKLVDLMGHTFRGIGSTNENGVFGLLKILGTSNLSSVPDTSILELLGTVFLSVMEVEMIDCDLTNIQISVAADFHKSLLDLLGSRMNQFPISNPSDDQKNEEIVELAIQVWMLSSKISNTLHWNNMMYQRFLYLGNSIARHRFMMFFCLEYTQYGIVDSFVLQEIEKILLSGLVSPTLSKYCVDLYRALSPNYSSIFHQREASISEVTSIFSLQNNRIRILTRSLEKIDTSSDLHSNEKTSIISALVKRLHDVYTDHRFEQGVTDMCKRITEVILRTAKDAVNNIDEFWELSTKLGFPNRNVQSKWLEADNEGKVKLLNSEFISALVYGKSHIDAMNNWITGDNDNILFALVMSYTCALTVSKVYWAHLSFLLDYVYVKLDSFQIKTNESDFPCFLKLLARIVLLSNFETNSRYAFHEIRALKTCLKICSHAKYVFDGYKDEWVVEDTLFDVYQNFDTPDSESEFSSRLMKIPLDRLQSGATLSYHPKHQHTPQEHLEAARDLREKVSEFEKFLGGYVNEKMSSQGQLNFRFL